MKEGAIYQEGKGGFPLSIVVNCRATYASNFKPTALLGDICEIALEKTSKTTGEGTALGGWKLSDRHGKKLDLGMKLEDSGIAPQDMIYLSKRSYADKNENILVRAEDKVEEHLTIPQK
jgi:hypothetical protein